MYARDKMGIREIRIHVCESENIWECMYVCERARKNNVLNGPLYVCTVCVHTHVYATTRKLSCYAIFKRCGNKYQGILMYSKGSSIQFTCEVSSAPHLALLNTCSITTRLLSSLTSSLTSVPPKTMPKGTWMSVWKEKKKHNKLNLGKMKREILDFESTEIRMYVLWFL